MSNSIIQPYLSFNGNCEEAMNFYQSVLGGDLDISRFGDFAGTTMPVPEDQKNKIMHCTLKSGSLEFMASDAMHSDGVIFGSSISMSIAGDDDEQLTKFFNGLAEGGKVVYPLDKQVWGDKFGMFDDKYGIHWMVNITAKKPAA